MRKNLLSLCLGICAIGAATSAHAIVGRNCLGSNLKITQLQLIDTVTGQPVLRWNVAQKQVTYQVGNATKSFPADCSDRRFRIPLELFNSNSNIKNGKFNIRAFIAPTVVSRAHRFYGPGLNRLAVRFGIGKTVNGAYREILQQTERGPNFDACGTYKPNGARQHCIDRGVTIKPNAPLEFQIRACSGQGAGIGCKGDDILLQGPIVVD